MINDKTLKEITQAKGYFIKVSAEGDAAYVTLDWRNRGRTTVAKLTIPYASKILREVKKKMLDLAKQLKVKLTFTTMSIERFKFHFESEKLLAS